MSNILVIKSSPRGAESVSGRLADELVQQLREQHPGAVVQVRDLAADPLPHISPEFAVASKLAPEQLTEEQRNALALSDSLVEELLAAEHVVVSTGMINLSIPSTLKAWIDHIVRYGLTFSYGENGLVGLAGGRRLYLVMASGGVYSGDRQSWDFQSSYLASLFRFIGMDDQQRIYAQGTLAPAEVAQQQLSEAREQITQLALAAVGA